MYEGNAAVEEDMIDLREYAEVVWKGKWVIIAIIAAAIAVAGVLSFVVIPPTYEAAQVVLLPRGEEMGGSLLSTELSVYTELATSLPVMEYVLQAPGVNLGEEANARTLAERFGVSIDDENSSLVTVTSSSHDPVEAYQLSGAWLDGFTAEVRALWEDQAGRRLTLAEEQLSLRQSEYDQARSALDVFDRENALHVLEQRLSRLEGELLNAESSLSDLKFDAIPTDRARLNVLEEAISETPRTLTDPAERATLPYFESDIGVMTSDVSLINPVYIQLSRDLAATRTRLTVNESRASSLENRLNGLAGEIQNVGDQVVALRTEREELVQEVSVAKRFYTEAREQRESIRDLSGRTNNLEPVTMISPASMPAQPVAPRKALNVAVAAVMGAFGGLFLVLIRHWWSSGNEAREETSEQSARGLPAETSRGLNR